MTIVEHGREWIRECADAYENPETVYEFADEASDEKILKYVDRNWACGLIDFIKVCRS